MSATDKDAQIEGLSNLLRVTVAERDRLAEALELKDSAYAHLKSGQTAKAERLAAESWRRRSDGALAASSGGEA